MQCHITGITRHIVARTVIIACAIVIRMPCALCHTGFIKLICNTVKRIFACYCSTGTAEETMPILIDLYPTTSQCTDLGITPLTVNLNKAGIFALVLAIIAEVIVNVIDCIDAGDLLTVDIIVISAPPVGNNHAINICLAVSPYSTIEITTALAFEYIVNEIKAMSCCRNGCPPIYNRVADLTIGSVGIARLSASRSLVRKSGSGMGVSAVPSIIIGFAFSGGNHVLCHFVHFGVNLRSFTGECIGRTVNKRYKTAVDLHADVDRPEFLHTLELSIGIRLFAVSCSACICITHFEFPGADRKRRKNAFADLIVCTCACNCDSGDILVFLNAVFSRKTSSNIHVIKLPLAHVVEVDVNSNGLNLFDISSNYICIPDRAEQDLVKRRIMRYDLDSGHAGIPLHMNRTYNRIIIALIITN